MFTYRRKPVEVEAVQWNGKKLEVGDGNAPDWIILGLTKTPYQAGGIKRIGDTVHVGAVDMIMYANPGDWIIRDQDGNLTVNHNDYFTATYEKV